MKYTIHYGYGIAELYTPSEDWESRFLKLANQCFGIRKSISQAVLIKQEDLQPTNKLPAGYEQLEHSGDLIIWDDKGEKIKTEWD